MIKQIFGFIFVVTFFWLIALAMNVYIQNKQAFAKQKQEALELCDKTCYPYVKEICYVGDVENIFIRCAGSKEVVIKSLVKSK